MTSRTRRRGDDPWLDAIDEMGQAEGLSVAELSEGDVIDVDTRNHRYTFILHDPARRLAEAMSNGDHITDPVDAVIAGSLLGESTIRMGWIMIGYRLEVLVDGQRIHLSSTRRISVNGVPILPRSDKDAAN
jgi:hypothetical protein